MMRNFRCLDMKRQRYSEITSCKIPFIDVRKTRKVDNNNGVSQFTPANDDLRTLYTTPGVVFIVSAATAILATKSSALSTGNSYTSVFIVPHKKSKPVGHSVFTAIQNGILSYVQQ